MADFSFSFDSDNPFAEPATPAAPAAPQPAASANGQNQSTDADAGDAPGATGAPDTDSPFGIDDFGFDEIESIPAPDSPELADSPAASTTSASASDEPNAFDFDFDSPAPASNEATPLPVAPEEFAAVAAPEATPLSVAPEEFAAVAAPDFAPAEFTAVAAPDFAPAEALAEAPDETDFLDIPTLEANAPQIEAVPFDFSLGDEPVAPTEPAPAVAAAPPASDFASEPDAETEDESDDHPRRRAPVPIPKVAILGASGIGKNHARWFHRNGAHIVAFLGTSDDSVVQTEAALNEEFAFEGQAYTDLAKLLETEKPDIVCVATPPALHFGHVLQSLEAGAHVLCEKPLVYAPTRKFRENRDGAKELVKVAAKKKLVLGTQLQYGAATPILCKLAGLAPNEVGDFAMEIETMNAGASRDPRELWIDLGPHPVSVAQMLAGEGAVLAEETIRFEPHTEDGKTEVLTRFGVNCADGRLLMVRAIVRSLDPNTTKRKPRRRFSFNGHPVTYAPLAGPHGSFQAQFIAPDGYSSVYPDPVDYLVGNFVRACRGAAPLLISGDFGRENLEWMLKIGMPPENA